MLCGQSALGGSSVLGDFCVVGGKAALADHVSVASHVRVAAFSGVTKNIVEPGDYAGFPAQPIARWRREVAAARRLADLEPRRAARKSA
jgi:UDP-3-O-[3-hydroxymyristoyl] glucosamine N-acyltransferase